MLLGEHQVSFPGTRESAWAKLVDWQSMHEWDIFVERLHFDGPLALGSTGTLKMKDGPTVQLVVTSFSAPHAYTDEFRLFGSTFVFHHELSEPAPGQVLLRIVVEGSGALVGLLQPLFKKQFKAKMPILMENFRRQYSENGLKH